MESPTAAPTEPAATMAAQSGLEPFRLMDLPTELRLMIYKQLPRQIKHTELRYHPANCFDNDKIDSIILVTRHLPTALLRTSREIYAEAHDIVAALIRTFVKESQPRVIEHDSYVQMLDVLRAVTTERERLAPGRSCDMIRVSQRHPEFVYHPEETEPPREVTQFICQATLATSNPIAIISCVDFDSTADHLTTADGDHLVIRNCYSNADMSTAQFESFPFLRLPTEIRLLVYEHLPRQVKHTEVSIDDFVAILVIWHLPTVILRTSKLIRAEAQPIIKRLIQEFIEESQTKIVGLSKSGSKIRHCKILECLTTQIPRERNAVEDLEH
ncbi:hypothetical protein GT037_000295 [Alternaria burnsii]|uniref:Uncharacterized protein n=1 Tax=Alternaria burnsii TaxID=1187904 RepID=A0A8H7BH15_9PLEO|nr:uncharacterized protein GT037_000295 [Alternaria burnsii]KAF7681319.1 hypothetical protein GT037_000295 [Alternaria burnsii]